MIRVKIHLWGFDEYDPFTLHLPFRLNSGDEIPYDMMELHQYSEENKKTIRAVSWKVVTCRIDRDEVGICQVVFLE